MAKFENVAEFIIVRFKGSFSIFVGKLKTVGSMEYFEEKFRLRESLELCRIWEKNFACCGKLSD